MSGTRNTYRAALLSPICRQIGHLFIRNSFFGFPIGKPYCMRCGRKADA